MPSRREKLMLVVPSLMGGGAEKVAATLCQSFRQTYPEIDILLVCFSGKSTFSLPHVRVFSLAARERSNPIATTFKFCKIILALSRIIRRESPRTILTFMDYANVATVLAGVLAGSGSRIVLSVHTRPSAQTRELAADIWERAVGFLIGRTYNRADAVIAVSKAVGDDLADNFAVERHRLRVVPNPVDLKQIADLTGAEVPEDIFSDGVPVILAVGRLSREKGHDLLLHAFARARASFAVRLVIVGEGREEASLRKLSLALGIDGDVVFLGYQANPFKYMARSTLFVLPSTYEGFALVLVEAMTCGLPVVATRSYQGIEEIVEPGETGLLVEVGDEEALTAAILRLLGDADLRRSLAESARTRVEAFAVDRITDLYGTVLGLPALTRDS